MAASTVRTEKPTTEESVALPEIVTLTREEMLDALDRAARYYLDMSGAEFLRRWEHRDFDDPDSSVVLHVGMFVPAIEESWQSCVDDVHPR